MGREAFRAAIEESLNERVPERVSSGAGDGGSEGKPADVLGNAPAPQGREFDRNAEDSGQQTGQKQSETEDSERRTPESGTPEGRPELTLADVAETLGLTETELYDKLSLNTGDGEAVTLAGAKEKLRHMAEFEQGIAQREAEADKLRSQYVSDVQALGVLDAMRQVPPDIRQKANRHLVDMAQREADNFRMLHPEYQDETRWMGFTSEVETMLNDYGLKPEHFGVRSAGLYRLLVDVLRDRRDAKAYRQPKPKPAPPPTKKSRPQGQKAERLEVSGNARQRFAQLAQQMRK